MNNNMKKMPLANMMLKELTDASEVEGADKFSELWDEPINDQFTFGDLMTNALEHSLNIEYGYFIIINDKKFSLINDNNEFNMDVVSIIMSKEILIYTKPKNMSNLDYIINKTPMPFRILKTKSNKDRLTLKPSKILRKFMKEHSDIDDNIVTMTIKDLREMDIVELVVDDN